MLNLHDAFQSRLENYLASLDLLENDPSLSEKADKLIAYLALLQKWNKVYNLTAIRDPEEMFIKHILDSVVVAPLVKGDRMIDVGTGGGLPGIPLAILFPERQVDLLDSNSKKTRFLIQVKAELALRNVEVIHHRVENFQPEVLYDAIVSRAFASLTDMVHWTHHLLVQDGFWWALKSQRSEEEVSGLPEFVKIAQIYPLTVPGLDAERTLIQAAKHV